MNWIRHSKKTIPVNTLTFAHSRSQEREREGVSKRIEVARRSARGPWISQKLNAVNTPHTAQNFIKTPAALRLSAAQTSTSTASRLSTYASPRTMDSGANPLKAQSNTAMKFRTMVTA